MFSHFIQENYTCFGVNNARDVFPIHSFRTTFEFIFMSPTVFVREKVFFSDDLPYRPHARD